MGQIQVGLDIKNLGIGLEQASDEGTGVLRSKRIGR